MPADIPYPGSNNRVEITPLALCWLVANTASYTATCNKYDYGGEALRCIGDTMLASSQAAKFPGSQYRWQSVTSVCHADKLAPDKIMTKPTCIDVHLGAIRCQWHPI